MTDAEFIAKWEGIKLEPYHDVAGYPTIGIGHKLSDRRWANLVEWSPITREQALAQLDEHLRHFRRGVHECVQIGLSKGQEIALTSFAFNLGLGALRGSKLLGMIVVHLQGATRPSDAEIALEWLDWCKATIDGRKQVVDGLLNRRRAEVALFFGVDSA